MFADNPGNFYRSIRDTEIKVQLPPDKQGIRDFWSSIWEKGESHNETADWISREERRTRKVKDMPWEHITSEEVKNMLSKSSSWKAPGPDGLQNYWLKTFTAVHEPIANTYNEILTKPTEIPNWLTEGKTILIPKNIKTEDAKNYRPITCLSTMYKNLTAILSDRIYQHLEENQLFPIEQKGCRRNSYGCKDHLLINRTITEDAKRKRKHLSMGWIDYQKAFDSVPHSWLLKILELNKVNASIIGFLRKAMCKWTVNLLLNTTTETIQAGSINIKRGIFQGDSLSPLLFCMALFPLSKELSESGKGYLIDRYQKPVSHLIYIDDLKLYGKNDKDLNHLLKIVKTFSDDISMKFGLDKCAKITVEKGEIIKTSNILLDFETEIKTLECNQLYKYLGMSENSLTNHEKMKEVIKKEYFSRVRSILKSELTGKNKFTAIASLAHPVLAYSFGVVEWKKSEIQQLDVKTRKLLTLHNLHHPKADVDRLYTSRVRGGRGLVSIEQTYKVTMVGLAYYVKNKMNDALINMLRTHEESRVDQKTTIERGLKYAKAYNLGNFVIPQSCVGKKITEMVKKTKTECRRRINDEIEGRWLDKPLHGQHGRDIKEPTVDKEQTLKWLCQGVLKGETESLIIAAQDQSIATNYIRQRIYGEPVSSKCRLCKQYDETIKHIMTACPILAKKEYIQRHNKVCACLHFNICRHYGIETVATNWYTHSPESVVNAKDVVVLWDSQVHTDRTVLANKPDIIVKDLKKRICYLIDVAIPADTNVTAKEAEKRLKYKDLQIEIQRMWGMNTVIIPVIIGATGTISKKFAEQLTKIPGNERQSLVCLLQKTALLGTAHVIRRAL